MIKKELNLFDILQNPAVGVIALHSFILGYNNVAKDMQYKIDYPPLNYLFFVLPLIYDNKTILTIKNKLYTSIIENKEMTLGLQERANKMSGQTFESLNLGFSKLIFSLDKENYTIEINDEYNKSILTMMNLNNQTLRNIQKYSTRLGNIFAKRDEKMLQLDLNIRF